jgi:hypothetical protein
MILFFGYLLGVRSKINSFFRTGNNVTRGHEFGDKDTVVGIIIPIGELRTEVHQQSQIPFLISMEFIIIGYGELYLVIGFMVRGMFAGTQKLKALISIGISNGVWQYRAELLPGFVKA